MNFEALGNLGEFISSIAVLGSLIYLGVQIRRSTETARMATYRSIVSDFGSMNLTMAADPELSYLYVQALEQFDELEPSQKARMSQLFYLTFRSFENMFYQHQKGYLEDEVWLGWERLMVSYFYRPGFHAWWEMRREVFSLSFAEFLENAELKGAIPSYLEITQTHDEQGPMPSDLR